MGMMDILAEEAKGFCKLANVAAELVLIATRQHKAAAFPLIQFASVTVTPSLQGAQFLGKDNVIKVDPETLDMHSAKEIAYLAWERRV